MAAASGICKISDPSLMIDEASFNGHFLRSFLRWSFDISTKRRSTCMERLLLFPLRPPFSELASNADFTAAKTRKGRGGRKEGRSHTYMTSATFSYFWIPSPLSMGDQSLLSSHFGQPPPSPQCGAIHRSMAPRKGRCHSALMLRKRLF